MAESSKQSFDPKRMVVVSNLSADVGVDELTIHFQKKKNGGGDVDGVVVDGNVAFVIFDLPEVVTSVLNHPKQVINGTKIEVQKYELWNRNKKRKDNPPVDYPLNSSTEDVEDQALKTIYVSGIESISETIIMCFFENKRTTGGGELCEGEEGFRRLSPSVARLKFVSAKDAQNVLRKAEETPLKLEGNVLTVSSTLEPTHDQSILLVTNLNPKTSKETLKNFVESTKNADVFKIVFRKDCKAIVILNDEIDEDYSDAKESSEMLEGFVVSLQFAPVTKAMRISNIPQGTSSDAIKFRFSNPKTGGSKVVNMRFDGDNRVAIIYFEEPSVVSALVKKEHMLENVSLTVVPYYEKFEFEEPPTTGEEQTDIKTETTEFQWDYKLDDQVVEYFLNHERIESKFDLKGMKYDKEASRLHVTKDFDDPNLAAEFENKLKEFLHSVKEDVKKPKEEVFNKVKEAIEDERDEYVMISASMLDGFTEGGRKPWRDYLVDDKNKLKCLNFIDYFVKLMKEYPDVQIHGMDGTSGKLLLLGKAEKTEDVKLRIDQDLAKFTEIDVKMSAHQLNFLQQTQGEIVNNELKKENAMLVGFPKDGAVDPQLVQVKIIILKKCDDKEKKRLQKVVDEKTSETCIKVDKETATFLSKSEKLQKFKKEQFDKNQVMIDLEHADTANIWIVCEKSKIDDAEQELASFIDKNKITSYKFSTIDPMKVRFLREHCWDKIKEKEENCKAEGVVVCEINAESFEVKGTKAGRSEMEIFLAIQAGKVDYKTYFLTKPGMKKQMSMGTTDAYISEVEKNHKCVIEKGISLEETDTNFEEIASEEDEKLFFPDTSEASRMNLPYHSIVSVNDREIKLTSGQRIRIEIGDLAQQTVDVIVNTTNDTMDLTANPCGKALLKVAGQELVNECKKIGNLRTGEMASSGPAKLNCKRVYHVRSSAWDNGNGALILRQIIKKCLEQLDKDKLRSIAIPAIGTGTLGFPREEVVRIFFEEVTNYLTSHHSSTINDVLFVVFDKATVNAFLGAVPEIKLIMLSPRRRTSSDHRHLGNVKTSVGPGNNFGLRRTKNLRALADKPSVPIKLRFRKKKKEVGREGQFLNIYSDEQSKLDKAWKELETKIKQNIQKRTISDDTIKKITDHDVEKLKQLERDYDFQIKIDRLKREVKLKGHILDFATVLQKINEILKDIKDNEGQVPSYWDKPTHRSTFHKFKLSTSSKEYKDVEAKFHKTASNQIVSIERIQNEEIYKLFNIKRQSMNKKYRYDFSTKEKMLFHGTAHENLEKINAGGLNRSYAGKQDTAYGRGVYFARDASYSCYHFYSPPDSQKLRYVYYARVLVGEYTRGQRNMIVPPNKVKKNSSDPNETYDSVVDNVADPKVYVLFQDYEYYTEYLITFR